MKTPITQRIWQRRVRSNYYKSQVGYCPETGWVQKHLRKRGMQTPGKEKNPEEKKHTEDMVFKTAGAFFATEALRLFHIPEKMRRLVPTEIVHLEARRMYEDFNIEMENGVWYHFEFESDRIQKKDLRRFREYEAVTGRAHQVDVVTYVVCTANAKEMVSSYKTGINNYRVKIIRLNRRSADRLFARVGKTDPEKISRQDLLAIVFSPLMKGEMSIRERVVKGFAYLDAPNRNADGKERQKMQAMLYMLATKFLTGEELATVKEGIGMTVLGQMLMDDGIQTGETRFAALTKKLLHDGRLKDLESAANDEDARRRFYLEYGLTDH